LPGSSELTELRARLAGYVVQNTREGDLDDVIRVIDEYCYELSFMINVGDEKGASLAFPLPGSSVPLSGGPVAFQTDRRKRHPIGRSSDAEKAARRPGPGGLS